jgi:hypothetical protein
MKSQQQGVNKLNDEIFQLRGRFNEVNLKKGQLALLGDQMKQLQGQQMEACSAAHKKNSLSSCAAPQATRWTQIQFADFLKHFNNEINRVEEETKEVVGKSKSLLSVHEQEFSGISLQIEKLQIEYTLKNEEYNRVLGELDDKKSEFQRLTSSKNAIYTNQMEFDIAQKNFNDFSESYAFKTADIKKQTKVKHYSTYSV